ncbi:MAG: PAS domain-containing protein [Candidatus Omnitrophota bacterium]|nr:PAS domain-containing protein [Candidatus Omnitrophota bacterium]
MAKRKKEQVSLEREFLQNLLDNIPDAVYFKDRHNRIVKVNKFYAAGFNRKPEEIIGKTDFDFFLKDHAQKMFADDDYVLNTGKSIIGKIERTLLPDGTWNQVITTKIPMHNKEGAIIGTMGITRDMTAYAHLEKERLDMLTNVLTVLAKTIEMRDPYVFSHAQRVSDIVEIIGRELSWDENRLLGMRLASQLHDLGKIGIPLEILNKPGKLNVLEYQLIQGHVQNSYDLLKDIGSPFSLAEIVYQHHERLDGSGYPRGLRSNQILLESKVLAVSDVLDSMTHHRPYREALGLGKAIEELEGGCGLKYDSEIVGIVSRLARKNNGNKFWETN